MDLTTDSIVRWIELYTDAIEENKQLLTDLDGAIGDNDHGINMDRGFRQALGAAQGERNGTVDAVLKAVGMTLIRTVGGASGPLYGTVFLRMAQACSGQQSLNEGELGAVLEAGCKGIADRGKAEPGDKTMLDAWVPAVRAYGAAREEGKDLEAALDAAARAAEGGMRDTVPLVARKGRASYLGERSAGHQDPGATSSSLLFTALLQAAQAT